MATIRIIRGKKISSLLSMQSAANLIFNKTSNMKKVALFFCFTISASIIMAQESKVSDNLSLKSKILNMDRKYAIYLPPDYETSQRSYPVLYLLHGGGDDQTGWVQFGEVQHIADKAIRKVLPHQ